MKTKFNDFLKEDIYQINNEFEKEVNGIPESEIIELFRERGMSSDKNENYLNEIQYDDKNNEINVTFTSYAFGGEMPNDLSRYMIEIADILGASNWTFWDPMSKVRFFFD